ncbi:MAG: DUF6036 family nucleotidyltransferase [Bacteroidota bacterium]|nr:DUF6036 family nucleotidyltransferase [Bacteroidota bacterium]
MEAAAFPAHGYSRTTQDIDITDEDLKTKKVLIRQYLVETDIHPFVKGVTFDEVWERKIETKIEDVKFFVASIDDLISMKKAAGRGKDLDDIRVLEKLKNI